MRVGAWGFRGRGGVWWCRVRASLYRPFDVGDRAKGVWLAADGTFEPQPALITLIRATIAKAASGHSLLLMFAPDVWGLR
jgi:hypothetical protein